MSKLSPKVESSNGHTVDGLTLSTIETKTFTFTLDQLKFAVTVEKPIGYPVTRAQAMDVLCGLLRKHRYELFGNCEPYKVITNGYGQFKYVEAYHGDKYDAKLIFAKLEKLLDN